MEDYIPGIDITVGLMSGKGALKVITEKRYMITIINIIIIIQNTLFQKI